MTRARDKNLQELISQVLETPEEASIVNSYFREQDRRRKRDNSYFRKKDKSAIAELEAQMDKEYSKVDMSHYEDFSKAVKWLSDPKPYSKISREEGERILRYLVHRRGTRFFERNIFIHAKYRYYSQLRTGTTEFIKDRPWYEAIEEPSEENKYTAVYPFNEFGGSRLEIRDFKSLIREMRKARAQLPRIYKMAQKQKAKEKYHQAGKWKSRIEYKAFMSCGNYFAQQRTLTEPEWNALAKIDEGAREIDDRYERNFMKRYGHLLNR